MVLLLIAREGKRGWRRRKEGEMGANQLPFFYLVNYDVLPTLIACLFALLADGVCKACFSRRCNAILSTTAVLSTSPKLRSLLLHDYYTTEIILIGWDWNGLDLIGWMSPSGVWNVGELNSFNTAASFSFNGVFYSLVELPCYSRSPPVACYCNPFLCGAMYEIHSTPWTKISNILSLRRYAPSCLWREKDITRDYYEYSDTVLYIDTTDHVSFIPDSCGQMPKGIHTPSTSISFTHPRSMHLYQDLLSASFWMSSLVVSPSPNVWCGAGEGSIDPPVLGSVEPNR